MTKIERLLKYTEGGKIQKMQEGQKIFYDGSYLTKDEYLKRKQQEQEEWKTIESLDTENQTALDMISNGALLSGKKYLTQTQIKPNTDNLTFDSNNLKISGLELIKEEVDPENFFPKLNSQPSNLNTSLQQKKELSDKDKSALGGMAAETAVAAINGVDNATMGDKNFSPSSQALDTAVHGVSSAMLKSGNPWMMGAAVALEGINFVTKAGGKNVQGYDVGINNAGYGTLGHQESQAGRIWDNWSGATARKLRKRNEQARMALAAADISEDQAYEQEARTNSVENILRQNSVALAGGIDTSLLAN